MAAYPTLQYFSQYNFSWEILEVFLEGSSALDIYSFMGQLKSEEQVPAFMSGYGFDLDNPIQSAELFGTFQEALQFIKRYFLSEGNPDGLPLTIPSELFMITDIKQLFLLATKYQQNHEKIELSLWAGVVLKVVHTFLHADKDLRHRYLTPIQLQIFDRFYKYLHRDENNQLFLGNAAHPFNIPLVEFQTKAKKSRDSIVIKLLHKKENVAEELFDRIGIRLITKNRFDCLRVIKFFTDQFVIVAQNIKPSRCVNTLFDLPKLKDEMLKLYRTAKQNQWPEDQYVAKAQEIAENCMPKPEKSNSDNLHSFKDYRAIHFTCRQLIKYTNPFMKEFSKVKQWAKDHKDNEASEMILKLDTSTISRDLMFFYPFELQITDQESHNKNTVGEASHKEYKSQQVKTAIRRLFKPLISLHHLQF